MYLVITQNKIKVQAIQHKVQVVCHCRTTWKRHTNKKELILCHNCHRWGHATANCYMPLKCLKCAQRHLTGPCTKTADTATKCINCNGDHPANSTSCEVYYWHLCSKYGTTAQQQPAYIDAQLPAQKVWELCRQQQQAQQHSSAQQQPFRVQQQSTRAQQLTHAEPVDGADNQVVRVHPPRTSVWKGTSINMSGTATVRPVNLAVPAPTCCFSGVQTTSS